MQIDYNARHDILYIRLARARDSHGHEDEEGVVLNYDFDTKKLVGIDIWGFRSRMRKNETVRLPIDVDLKAIYDGLPN